MGVADRYNKKKTGISAPSSSTENMGVADRYNAKIALTAQEKKDGGWFKAPLFDDGYDFGDVTRTILGTVTDIEENVHTAVFDATENLIDTTAYLVGGIGGIFSEDFRDGVGDFIAKDLLHSKEAGELLGKTTPHGLLNWAINKDTENASVLADKSDQMVQSGAHLVGQAALQAVGVPWWLTSTVNSFGSEIEGAFQQGATYDEAGLSGAITAGAEVLTEKLSGGIKFGGKAATDAITDGITKGISNKIAKSVVKFGLDATGEGLEEIVSGYASAIGQKMTYMDDKELNELFSSEDKIDAFIGGFILGGGNSVITSVKNSQGGRDPITALTANEQKVLDSEYNRRVAEAEKDGKKLTKREKNEIYDQVQKELKKGYISTDTIESVLGGDTYKTYRDTVSSEDALIKEYEELRKMKKGEMNDIQQDRLAELKAMNLTDTAKRDSLKEQLRKEVYGQLTRDVKGKTQTDNYLLESYNEQARRGNAFEADVSKYSDEQAAVVQKAIDSGILNNTKRTHEFVDMIAKISADKGVPFDFANNEKIKESGFALEGRAVNGYVTNDGITLNVNSSKALNTVVGHEITHVLEGTELYGALQTAAIEYAKAKGEYDSRYKVLESLYKNVEGTDIDAELTADLIGDYLFTDEDFIRKLSAEHRNVFQKIYDEIKYLCKIATAGSKEARQLEKVKRVFDKVYRENVKAKENTAEGGVKYSLSDNAKTEVKNALNNKNYAGEIKLTDNSPAILLSQKGVRNLPMVMNASHIRENVFTEDEARSKGLKVNPYINYHGLGEDLFLEVIEDLDNVTEAYRGTKNAEKAERRENYFLLISQHTDSDGNIINIPVYINEKGLYNRVFIDTNKISTVFGRSELRRYINEQIKKGNLVRVKKGDTRTSESTSPINADYETDISSNSIPQNSEKSTENRKNSLSAENTDIGPIGNYNVFGKDIALEAPTQEDISETEQNVPEAKTDARKAAEAQLAEIEELRKLGVTSDFDKMKTQVQQRSTAEAQDQYGRKYFIQAKSDGTYVAMVEGEDSGGFVANELNKECNSFEEAYVSVWEYLYGQNPELYSDTISSYVKDYNSAHGINETAETVADFAPISEEEANAMQSENLASLDDTDAPPEVDAPYYENDTPIDPFDDRDIKDVGDRKVKAYMYENPEVKPFFQEEAKELLYELKYDTVRGERYYTPTPDGRPWEYGSDSYGFWTGVKRHTTPDIAYLLDNGKGNGTGYTYDEIEAGLNAIIEDNGEENNACSKRIEFIIHDRLSNGYQDGALGFDIPANQDYLNLLKEKQITEYSEEARKHFFEHADDFAPMAEDLEPAAQDIGARVEDAEDIQDIGPIQDDLDNQSITTVKERLLAKLSSSKGELANNQEHRKKANNYYEEKIASVQLEYDSKKNKDTKIANNLLRRIERIKRLKDNVDADYAKRINDIESRISKINAELQKDHTKVDKLEREYARIDKRLEQDKLALTKEFEEKRATIESQLEDKNGYISNRATELYNEISNLRKGVRASQELGYLLDHGFSWSTIKSKLLTVKQSPSNTVNPNSVEESVIREMLDEEYNNKLYDIEEEYQQKLSQLEQRAEKERDEARKADQRIKISELHQNLVDGIKSKFTEKGLDFDEVLKKAKDLSTLSTVDNTPQRVMEKALGYENGQILADETVNKVAQNETEGIKWLNSFTDRKNGLLAKISKQYNIKPGSKESAAAQMYAEGFYVNDNNELVKYGDAELAKDFPDESTQKNIKGLANDPRIRQIYDDTLEAINESRKRNSYPEIPRLENYFLHFRAMEDTFSRLGLPFNPKDIKAKDLPTDLNGVTADLKPGQPYFASAKHRMGKRTSFDLLGGLERYLSSAKNQIYHIDDIQTLRALRNYIADNYGQANGLEGLDSLSEEEAQEKIKQVYNSHLSTFAKFLNEEANIIAGKTALIDRGLEGIIGRRGIAFLDTVNKQVGSNMVGFNVSSSLTNFVSGVQAIAKTNKFSCVKAFGQTVKSKLGSLFGKTDSFVENNPTIIRRKGADSFYRTPFQKIGDAGYVLMSAVDNVTTEFIVRAKYDEFIKRGMSEQEAVVEADKWTSRLMGDRSLGQMPQLYNSKMLGLVTKFQLEVRNQLDSQFYDTIKEAQASNKDIQNGLKRNAKTAAMVTATFFELAVLQHLFGIAFESVAGYNPTFDIIEVLIKTLGFDDEEDSEDTILDNVEEGFLTLLEDLPYTSTFTGGRIPISSALPIKELIKGEDEYGNEKSRLETFGEAVPYYLLPTGYGQAKKTAKGLSMFDDDKLVSGSYTDSGNLRFPVEDTFGNRAQAALFGQWANKNARDYFDNERTPLAEKQIQEYADIDIPIAEYWEYREGLKGLKTLEEKLDYIDSLDLPLEKKNILANNVADRKEPLNMENYGSYDSYEEFDFAEHYPEKSAVVKAIGGYKAYKRYSGELNDIEGDKDKNGNTVSGSRKEKVIEYINGLDADYGEKIILFKSEYKSDNTYNRDILEYLNSREDISYEEMVAILTELGFKIGSDGKTVTW